LVGLEALSYLRSQNTPPAAWKERQSALLHEAAEPRGILGLRHPRVFGKAGRGNERTKEGPGRLPILQHQESAAIAAFVEPKDALNMWNGRSSTAKFEKLEDEQ
jgi:hypothetical protein